MMGVFKSLTGMVAVELTGADIAGTLSRINEAGIPVFDVQHGGELSAKLKIRRRDYRRIHKLTERKGDTLRVVRLHGLYWTGKRLLKRPILTFGLLLLLVLALFLPTRVLFVRVEGNEVLPDNRILSAAQDCGIGFGASRRVVRSEIMKNTLLASIPELQWAGVNTYGCVAVISVRERAVTEKRELQADVSSIVADRDGVILSVTVTNGNGLCAAGQAVKEGDILISGYTDCGLYITATRAEGEILARTRRALMVMTPSEQLIRGASHEEKANYSLIVGKKRINFYKGSGICDASCVKMYKEYCLTLPGGFELPVKLVKESVLVCEPESSARSEEIVQEQLTEFSEGYLRQQMVAGTITDRKEQIAVCDGAWCLAGEYACTEMIGRVQTEEIGVIP